MVAASVHPDGPPSAPSEPPVAARVKHWLSRHPIVCLALLTPGIPEYLSSSSPLNAIVLNPGQFVFQLVANLGLYVPGALLVREARIRWNAGWTSVLLLGAAYGTLEEGIALSTMFNPRSSVVGALGEYGHFAGVNWVWVPGVLFVHMVLSIALPIALLDLALPSTRGRRFLSRRGLVVAFVVLGVDVAGLAALVRFGLHFWMGWGPFVGAWLAIAGAVWAAHRLAGVRRPRVATTPRGTPWGFYGLGLAFFPGILFPEAILASWRAPPVVTIAVLVAIQGTILWTLVRCAGPSIGTHRFVAFVSGVLTPIFAIGVVAEWPLPITVAADLVAVSFLVFLWRNRSSVDLGAVPSTASAPA
jgi:hypothetical protein